MAGLGLIHLGFLAAAAAVAVPILIHLLLRPRARPVQIGTIRFLKLVLRDSTRRRKLRRWLLLALRSLAILLLALLFARPYWSRSAHEGRQREVILLIDQSASMGTTQSGQTFFTRAQEAAAKILKEQPEETALHLAYFDSQGVVSTEDNALDRTRLAGYAGTDYGLALRWARDLLVLSPRPHKKLFLVTDLQRSGLRPTLVEGFPSEVPVEVIEIGKAPITNFAVELAEATQTMIRPGEAIQVSARAVNAGPFPARNIQVRLVLEGPFEKPKQEQVQTLTLPPASHQLVQFAPPIQKPGLYKGYVEVVGEDDFPLDNRRWLAFEARTPDRLLLVDGQPGNTVYANETYYLEAALRLRLPDKGAPLTPYEPERLAWNEGAHLPELKPYRVVALCNVASLSEDEVGRLRGFVSGGGRLLIFTGNHVRAAGYAALHQAGLLPAAIAETQANAESTLVAGLDLFRFATWDKDHPIFRPLSDPQHGDLRRIGFRKITPFKPDPGAKVLAATEAGHPLVVEGRLEQGVILLIATAADRDWSDWPQSRLYVPLIHQIMGYLTGRLPENQRIINAPAGPGRDNPPGVTQEGQKILVHNIDPEESVIERLTVEQFRQAFGLSGGESALAARPDSHVAHLLPGNQRPDELWPYVIWLLLLILVIEVFVANRSPG